MPLSRNLGTLTSWNPLGTSGLKWDWFNIYLYIYTIEEEKKELLHNTFQIAQGRCFLENIKIDIKKNTLFVNYQIQPAQKEHNYVPMRHFRVS